MAKTIDKFFTQQKYLSKGKDENKSLFHTIEAERIGDNPLKEMVNFSTGKKMTPYLKPTTKQWRMLKMVIMWEYTKIFISSFYKFLFKKDN